MLKKLSIIVIFSLLTLISIKQVFAIDGKTLSKYSIKPQAIGNASYYFGPFKIYDAKLYSSVDIWKQSRPFALELTYKQNIKGLDIAKKTIQEIKAQGITDKGKLDNWSKRIIQIIPNVSKGDDITGVLTKDTHIYFYKNNKQLGFIDDPEFSQLFFNIWLGQNTENPTERNKLIKADTNVSN